MKYEFYANSENEFNVYKNKIGQKVYWQLGEKMLRVTVMSAIDDKIVISIPDDEVVEFLVSKKDDVLKISEE